VWSPDGERIAFTKIVGATIGIGVMSADGSDERIVSTGPDDEEPSWSPDGARVLFQRLDRATRRTVLASVPAKGGAVRTVLTPQSATDPAWVERRE
jgi:TolB protein